MTDATALDNPDPVLNDGAVGNDGAQNELLQTTKTSDSEEAERRLKTVETIVASDARQWDKTEHDWRDYSQKLVLFATSEGGEGGKGGKGGDGSVAIGSIDSGNGGAGGDGGDGGDAIATAGASSLQTGGGRDKISVFATSAGGDGGDGGAGGRGGFAVKSINSGNGGDGGDAGDGGAALSFIKDLWIDAGGGNDRINLVSTAVGGSAGNGGAGGHKGYFKGSIDSGNGGDGGDAGHGGQAEAYLVDTSVVAGSGNDDIRLSVTAYGASSGKGGSFGKGGSASYGSHAGSGGLAGEGGSGYAAIAHVSVDAGQGNDEIRISLTALVGKNGKGQSVNTVASIELLNNTFLGNDGDDRFILASKTNKTNTIFDVSGNTFDGGVGKDKLDLKGWAKAISLDFANELLDLGSGASNAVKNFESVVGTSYADKFTFSQHASGLKVTGGSGSDSYLVTIHDQVNDVISDFSGSSKGGDRLLIDDAVFSNLLGGAPIELVSVNDVAAASSAGSHGYFIYDKSGASAGSLYFDATGGASNDAVDVILLANKPNLSASDFFIV